MQEAQFWKVSNNSRDVECGLCPHRCRLAESQHGICGVRANKEGRLVSLCYGLVAGYQIDPIEKKPLYHFLPGSQTLSFGTVGCNFNCSFCQNFHLSRGSIESSFLTTLLPHQAVDLCHQLQLPSISFTYNEPIINAEWVMETAYLAKKSGLKTIVVSNGYINRESCALFFENIDAANIDLKSMDQAFYHQQCQGDVGPVLRCLEYLKAQNIHLEITQLLIPDLNDREDQVLRTIEFVRNHLGYEVPLHFSAFRPMHRLLDKKSPDLKTMNRAKQMAHDRGLRFVYLGNIGLCS